MRKILLCATGLAAALLSITPAMADQSRLQFTCDEFAAALADHANKNDMQWAGDFDTDQPGKVLIIGAGKKFYVPAHKNPQDFAPKTALDNLRQYDDDYQEAYWRCFSASNITINVQK